MLQRAASNAYSWWWASQIRTKQSKWLENSLQDMEEKVNAALKLLQEDAETFAKKAEMYYRRRPEMITFVQETYKGYKSLAERYDRISGELHKANNTIATVFPDQHFGMDDDDDDGPPTPKATAADTSKFRKMTPPAPPAMLTKSTKPSTPKAKPGKKKKANPYSNASPEKAREQIDKLQKEILVLQTEKEYMKGTYESGLSKYWEIEKKITDMQDKVCRMQDDYGEETVIEDDEARALMAVTALKSCENTLINLQEKHKQAMEEARTETERIKGAKERIVALKKDCGQPVTETQNPSEDAQETISVNNMERVMHLLSKERMELQSMCEKVRKSFQTDSEVTVLDLAEKIDELVTKVIALETTESLQTAQIQRLKQENDELHDQLQSLENEKTTLAADSTQLSEKMRQLENELSRVQELNKNIREESGKLQASFSNICHTFNDLSDKLQSPEKIAENETASKLQPPEKNAEDKATSKSQPPEKKNAEDATVTTVKPEVVSEISVQNIELQVNQKPENMQEKTLDDPSIEMKDSTRRSVKFADAEINNKQDAGIEAVAIPDNINVTTKEPETVKANDTEAKKVEGPEATEAKKVAGPEATEAKKIDVPETNSGIDARGTRESSAFGENEPTNNDAKTEGAATEGDESHCEKSDDHGDSTTVNWQQLLMDGLEGREKALLNEYTSVLRNFKETKRKLTEAEKKNQEFMFETRSHIRDLKNSIIMKDEEIKALRQKLKFMEGGSMEGSKVNRTMSDSSITKAPSDADDNEVLVNELKLTEAEEPWAVSSAEEKFRRDIDELLEENLEFWIRFSSSFQQIQRFQIAVQTLQAEIGKLKEPNKKQDGSSKNSSESLVKPEVALLHKQLNDLQTDLSIWVEQNGLLTEELHSRFSSLDTIKDEILRVSKEEPIEGEAQFTPYQASKYQGEVLSIQHENNKVADELQTGLVHVRSLQEEVDKSLMKFNEKFGLGPKGKGNAKKANVPLKSFLFGSKPKKQSMFACVNPAMQRPFSDLLLKPPR